MRVSLVEQMVQRPPRDMDNWRMYRIEYGGHAENCIIEGTIWLPLYCDAYKFEKSLQRLINKTLIVPQE